MIQKIKIILTFFLFCNLSAFGQTITKKEAIKIAKQDTIVRMERIKSIKLGTDSTTNTLCWIVEEKINVNKENRKILKSKVGGMHYINADKILINATSGEIVSREKIMLGSIHKMPDF
ncbi:MAG TPA: hypothetical protein VE978_13160 [Chitinophagales bacterium]|nr:hypothetical protein [Chitinophagales bacterium]